MKLRSHLEWETNFFGDYCFQEYCIFQGEGVWRAAILARGGGQETCIGEYPTLSQAQVAVEEEIELDPIRQVLL